MFKGDLIENKSYYKLRRKQMVLTFIPSLLIGISVNYNLFPIWITVISIILYLYILIRIVLNQKKITSFTGKTVIEIDASQIRIVPKDGTKREIINLDEIDKISIEYTLPEGTIKDLKEEFNGKSKKNILTLTQNKIKRDLEFVINSSYMQVQLTKAIENWKAKNYHIEKSPIV